MKILKQKRIEWTDHGKVRHFGEGRCDCGGKVPLGWNDTVCRKCGAEYNSAGQRLAPREQWGEETGEDPSEVARAFAER